MMMMMMMMMMIAASVHQPYSSLVCYFEPLTFDLPIGDVLN